MSDEGMTMMGADDARYFEQFMLGVGPFAREYFGDAAPMGERGAFWWRKYFRAYAARLDTAERELAAVRARLDAAEKGWQDIASAPKDGSKVDLWLHIYASPMSFGFSDDFRVIECWHNGKNWVHEHDGKVKALDANYITHWQTLPSTPSRHEAIAAWNHRTTPTPAPALDEREAVARAMSIALGGHGDARLVELQRVNSDWVEYTAYAESALSALAPIRAAEIEAARENERIKFLSVPIVTQDGRNVGIAHRSVRDLSKVDAFIDEAGTAWTPPTAWAYFAACRARDVAVAEILAPESNERARIVAWLRGIEWTRSENSTLRHVAEAIERNEHGAGK